MGIFWDLLQQNELAKQQRQANGIEERVELLEAELEKTKSLLRKTLVALEDHIGQDIDGDGLRGNA